MNGRDPHTRTTDAVSEEELAESSNYLSNAYIGLVIAASVVFAGIAVVIVFCCIKRNREPSNSPETPGSPSASLQETNPLMPLDVRDPPPSYDDSESGQEDHIRPEQTEERRIAVEPRREVSEARTDFGAMTLELEAKQKSEVLKPCKEDMPTVIETSSSFSSSLSTSTAASTITPAPSAPPLESEDPNSRCDAASTSESEESGPGADLDRPTAQQVSPDSNGEASQRLDCDAARKADKQGGARDQKGDS